MPKRKINRNDLLPWFTEDHGQLPAAYLKSCAEFFEWLNWQSGNRFKATSNKPQARKPASLTNQLGNYKKDT